MWNLEVIEQGQSKDWRREGTFATLKDAAKEIIRLENMPVTGLFLQMHVETNFGEDEEFLELFIFDGKNSSYTIRKSKQ